MTTMSPIFSGFDFRPMPNGDGLQKFTTTLRRNMIFCGIARDLDLNWRIAATAPHISQRRRRAISIYTIARVGAHRIMRFAAIAKASRSAAFIQVRRQTSPIIAPLAGDSIFRMHGAFAWLDEAPKSAMAFRRGASSLSPREMLPEASAMAPGKI